MPFFLLCPTLHFPAACLNCISLPPSLSGCVCWGSGGCVWGHFSFSFCSCHTPVFIPLPNPSFSICAYVRVRVFLYLPVSVPFSLYLPLGLSFSLFFNSLVFFCSPHSVNLCLPSTSHLFCLCWLSSFSLPSSSPLVLASSFPGVALSLFPILGADIDRETREPLISETQVPRENQS